MERFPKDFMFQLTQPEWENLKSQIVISSCGGFRRANSIYLHRARHGYALDRPSEHACRKG
jgi:hypothetical protein